MDTRAIDHDCANLRLTFEMLVTNKFGLTCGIDNLAVFGEIGMAALLSLSICFSAILLLFHEPAEAILINFQTSLGCHLQSKIKWESICIVEFECRISRKSCTL